MEQVGNNDSANQLKSFWRKDGTDYFADLGGIKNSIVVRYYTPDYPTHNRSYYSISLKSEFPYTKEQQGVKYDNHIDCCLEAERIILDWVQSLVKSEQKPILNPKLLFTDELPPILFGANRLI